MMLKIQLFITGIHLSIFMYFTNVKLFKILVICHNIAFLLYF